MKINFYSVVNSRSVYVLFFLFFCALPHNVFADYNANDDTEAVVLQAMYSGGWWDGAEYWSDADALETIENTILRTNGQSYMSVIPTTFNAGSSNNFEWTGYLDDEGWWCNSWIRAYDLTGNVTYLNMAKTIFSDISNYWTTTTCGGGLWWQKPDNGKGDIEDELFFLAAVRLHQRTPGDSTYLNWAATEYNWIMNTSGWFNNPANPGLVEVGFTSAPPGQAVCTVSTGPLVSYPENGPFTYNEGPIVGALVDYYKITGNTTYLSQAETIATAAITGMVDANGILTDDCGSGDCDEFKGIFMRYLFYLYDTDHNPTFYNFLSKNAQSIWNTDRNASNQYGMTWDGFGFTDLPATQNSAMNPGAVIADPWTSTMVFARGSQDPEFSHTIGYAAGTFSWACDPTTNPTANYMQYGPYVSYLATGNHTVHFRLAAAATNCSSSALVHLDVRENNGGTILAAMDVPWAAFVQAGKPQDFALAFANATAGDPLEFRAYWNAVAGSTKVTLSDITVDGGYNWTAANLTHAIGRLDGVNQWEADPIHNTASGYMQEGPGTSELGSANCQAVFELKVDNFGYDSNQVATLSVVDDDTGTTMATQNITRNQFTSNLFQNFTLNFTTTLGHHYDYRIYYDYFANAPRLTARGVYTSVLSTIAVPTPTISACANSGILGNNAVGTGGYNLGGQLDCSEYTLSQAMTVTSMSIYMGAGTTGSGVLGIYSNNGGIPGTLLVQSAAQPLFPGWNVFAVVPTVIRAGSYWLSGSFTGAAYYDYSSGGGGVLEFENYTYSGTLPCTVGSLTGYGWLMSIYASGCFVPVITPTPITCGSSGTLGNTAAGTGGYNLGGQLDCALYTLSQPMTVSSMKVYIGAGTTGSGVLGIYSNNAGSPGTLLTQSFAQALSTGWNSFSVPPTVLTAGSYWLSGSFNGTVYYDYSNGGGGSMAFETYPYTGTMPSAVGSTTGYGWLMSIYASGCLPTTPTSTVTNTPTITPTNTMTLTATASSTATSTTTFTPSPTGTATFTNTVTNSFSPTMTNTGSSTATISFTPSYTVTRTFTFTSSNTVTPTSSPTGTSSSTASPTETQTLINTGTPTGTPTLTCTSTKTLSPTATTSPTLTSTQPPSTFTRTFTASATKTGTSTATQTSTYSFTPTTSPTPTSSPAGTSTLTNSPTYTFTATPIFTKTIVPTLSPTWTATATSTSTRSFMPTFTVTSTFTPTVVLATATPTAVSACSGVPAWNGNFVAYALGAEVSYGGELYQCIEAHTSEPNWEPPVVPALWKDLGPCGSTPTPALAVQAPVVYPNPVTSSTANIQLPVANATNVKVQMFTISFREVQTFQVSQVFGNSLTVQLMDKSGTSLANGLYYFVIHAGSQKWMTKVLVLR